MPFRLTVSVWHRLPVILDLSTGELVLAIAVLASASFIRGYSGFGFSAVLVAGLSFVVDPIEAVPLAIGFEVLASVLQARSVRYEIRWPDFRLLLIAAVIGNPIGVIILTTVDAEVLRAATFGVLLVLSGALLIRRAARIEATILAVFTVGVVAGVVNGATAMSGLVLVLAMSFIAISAAEIRATLVAYFFASDLLVIGLLAVRGDIDEILVWRIIAGLPILAGGIALGSRWFRRSTEAAFRTVTLGLLIAISMIGLLRIAI